MKKMPYLDFLDPDANRRLVQSAIAHGLISVVAQPPLSSATLNGNHKGRPSLRVNPVSMTWAQKAKVQTLRNELQTLRAYRAKAEALGMDLTETDANIIEVRKEIEASRLTPEGPTPSPGVPVTASEGSKICNP